MGAARSSSNLIGRFAFLATILQLACSTPRAADPDAAASRVSNQLIGSWDARFELGSAFPSASSRPKDVRGMLTFVRTASGAVNVPDMVAPVTYGLYDADFTSFGFDIHDGEGAPTAVAGIAGAVADSTDSVVIVIGPKERGVSVLLRGKLNDGKLNGAWTTESGRAGIAEWGRFSMTRHRRGDF